MCHICRQRYTLSTKCKMNTAFLFKNASPFKSPLPASKFQLPTGPPLLFHSTFLPLRGNEPAVHPPRQFSEEDSPIRSDRSSRNSSPHIAGCVHSCSVKMLHILHPPISSTPLFSCAPTLPLAVVRTDFYQGMGPAPARWLAPAPALELCLSACVCCAVSGCSTSV